MDRDEVRQKIREMLKPTPDKTLNLCNAAIKDIKDYIEGASHNAIFNHKKHLALVARGKRAREHIEALKTNLSAFPQGIKTVDSLVSWGFAQVDKEAQKMNELLDDLFGGNDEA